MTDLPTDNWQAPVGDSERAAKRHGQLSAEQVRDFTLRAARLAHDRHCEDVLLLDVRGLSDLTDYVLIATGTSDRQIRAVAQEVAGLAKEAGLDRYGRELDKPTTWVAIDFIDVMAHFFDPDTRAHYDIEMLWGDAPRVAWRGG